MSVPLPSPSEIAPATPKYRSRPQPITDVTPSRRPHSPSSPRASAALVSEENWRDRNNSLGQRSNGRPGPERTIGGFEKREVRTALGDGNGSVISNGNAFSPGSARTKDKMGDGEVKPAALSRVPCRFFKAGACTAGSSCPFSHEEGGKKEVCQWFLKGNCKFGHKCALAHVRPGEPMSMDRKNKKDAQRGIRDRGDGRSRLDPFLDDYPGAAPVPIRSALTSSIQSPSLHRQSSSPMREPYGPPSGGLAGSPSPGFGYPKSAVNYASSPSRPSPLSAGIRPSVPGQLSLKSAQSPLRPPPTTAFSSSFSHSTLSIDRSGPPLSASYADSTLRKSIWAPSDTPEEQLSPARRPAQPRMLHSSEDVFRDDDPYDHGEDLVPSFLLTPTELARRTSRRDSGDSFSASPSRSNIHNPLWNGERLAQSAGATMGPPGFLQGLWSAEGADARKSQQDEEDFTFGPATAQPPPRQSLLTQQRSPESPKRTMREPAVAVEGPFLIRPVADPHSPSARALREHAPGQSLPGGLANALSRLHLHGPRPSSGLAHEAQGGVGDSSGNVTPPSTKAIRVPGVQRDEHEDEALFTMDG